MLARLRADCPDDIDVHILPSRRLVDRAPPGQGHAHAPGQYRVRRTSLVLAFRHDTIDMTQAENFRPTAETTPVPPTGAVKHGWIASDPNPAGAVGEAHLATAAKGEITARHLVVHRLFAKGTENATRFALKPWLRRPPVNLNFTISAALFARKSRGVRHGRLHAGRA